jgi:hypothetical protein
MQQLGLLGGLGDQTPEMVGGSTESKQVPVKEPVDYRAAHEAAASGEAKPAFMGPTLEQAGLTQEQVTARAERQQAAQAGSGGGGGFSFESYPETDARYWDPKASGRTLSADEVAANRRQLSSQGPTIQEMEAMQREDRALDASTKSAFSTGGRGGGASQPDPRSTQGVVNQQRAQSAGAQYDYSSKTTSINQSNMFGNRGQRVSPLSQSWMFPFQPQSQQLRIVQGGGMKWAMVGVGLLFAAGLVLAFKD